jgi:acetyl esterase/lipase
MHRRRSVTRASVVTAAVAALVLVAAACDPNPTPGGPAPLRYRDNVFTNYTKTADVTYGTAVNQLNQVVSLKVDVYQPQGDTETSRPLAIWVHGGGFSGGNKTSAEIVDQSINWALKGYVSAAISYRLHPSGCSAGGATATCIVAIVQALQDAQTAVRFFRANAATYGIDTSRIAIGGSSAGAITALNVGYNGENPGPGDHQGFSSSVRAAQSLSGAALGTGPIGPGDAAAILFHNEFDPLVPRVWADNTVSIAKSKGLPVHFVNWPGSGHVPYAEHRIQIHEQTRNWYYKHLDLAHAAQ